MIKKFINILFIKIYILINKKFLLKPNMFKYKSYSSDDRLLFSNEWFIDIDWLFFNLTIVKRYNE